MTLVGAASRAAPQDGPARLAGPAANAVRHAIALFRSGSARRTYCRTSHANPHRAALARFNRLLDELHAAQPVVDCWEIILFCPQRLAIDVAANGTNDTAID